MTFYTPGRIRKNRALVIEALRAAPESQRLLGQPIESRTSEEAARAGRKCACAVAAIALGIPLLMPPLFEQALLCPDKRFNYIGVERALDLTVSMNASNVLIMLNDALSDDEEDPRYTFAQIADKLEVEGWDQRWGPQ